MNDAKQDIMQEIYAIMDYLPKKQKKLCEFITEHPTEVSMMSVAELSEKAGTGSTTVLRLAEKLGYDNYNAFKRAVLDSAVSRGSSSYQQMKSSFSEMENSDLGVLQTLFGKTETAFRNFLIPANDSALEEMIEAMLHADQVYITGARSSGSLALYLCDSLRLFMHNVHLLSSRRDYEYDRIYDMKPGDVLLAISAWPCSRWTITDAGLAAKRGVPVMLLTNTKLNPIARMAKVTIDTNSMNDSCTQILFMTAVTALIQELGRRSVPRSSEALENLERFLDENEVIVWEQKGAHKGME